MDAPQLNIQPVTNTPGGTPAYAEDTADPTKVSESLYGPTRHSALIFWEYADHIKHEVGIDVFKRKAQMEADRPIILQLLNKFRRDRTFADESILDEVWQEFLRETGVLT